MRRSLEIGRPGQACQTWHAPECPFAIEWSADAMEEIRGAAMEAFFSLPHGGAEIGGVLWGTRMAGCVRILAARPLECEHALGPTFTLSGKDHTRLAALLEVGCNDPRAQDWKPLGWYHSHTRSEISLSARDVEIHNRYFPDPWQVALVVRPHAMEPMRAGFFFREANGSIHADSSHGEFLVQPAPLAVVVQPPPQGEVGQAVSPVIARPARTNHSLAWLVWVAVVLGMAAGPFAFKSDWTRIFAAHQSPTVSLMAYDLNGQLQIHWDWEADPIRSAEAGTLEVTDGATHTAITLDGRLRGGTVSYVRIGARVDLRLALREPGGKVYEEFASFLGRAGGSAPNASTARTARELQDQAARVRQLERAVSGLRIRGNQR